MTWREVFGHEEPYPEQADGVEAVVSTADDGGYTVLEGACGTGKTMLALTAGIDRVRDPDSPFERVLVLTSVKQQLRQFEDDLRTINENLPEDRDPVSGLTLVGKADVCPYARENAGGIDESSVYDRCEGLRERTRSLVGDSETPKASRAAGADGEASGDAAGDRHAERSGGGGTTAGTLVSEARSAQVGLADTGSGGPDYLETAGEPTPYLPETGEYEDTEFCPFYARFLDDLPEDGEPAEAVPFDLSGRGLLDTEELVSLAAGRGSCPHSVMGAALPEVEVVVGNYYHAFDPTTTGAFTGALLSESTFVVCDEAHMLEPRVRDLVSDAVGDRTLREAESELARVVQPVRFDERDDSGPADPADGPGNEEAELVRGELGDTDVSVAELERLREFLGDLRGELDRRVTAHLDRERTGWRADLTALDGDELPLRDPETPGPDAISEWADDAGYGEAVWARAEAVGAVAGRVLDELEAEDKRRAVPAAGRVLNGWYRRDHETYFREIDLERTWDETEPPDSWRRAYNAALTLYNCVPSEAIGERLAEFGGGVLMSATLAPTDVFRTVAGLDHLEREGRPVVERTYGLTFPEGNRASFAVDAPKFTYENRGAPGEATEARRVHEDAVAAVASSPGNVLVGMPNYREAEWMAAALDGRGDVSKPVLLDEASGDDATESLKAEFFAGEGKVLVTSIRGTLTEGVDYRGDRLSAAAVCGVPIIDTSSPHTRAVRTAYDRAFDRDGFETALTVPAVRKARQAIGRVIRAPEEVGVRALIDARYARDSWDGVREFLPATEREEFGAVSTDMVSFGVERFWSERGRDA